LTAGTRGKGQGANNRRQGQRSGCGVAGTGRRQANAMASHPGRVVYHLFISVLLMPPYFFRLLQKYHIFAEYLAPPDLLWIMPA
jgi:hypothetical protein